MTAVTKEISVDVANVAKWQILCVRLNVMDLQFVPINTHSKFFTFIFQPMKWINLKKTKKKDSGDVSSNTSG